MFVFLLGFHMIRLWIVLLASHPHELGDDRICSWLYHFWTQVRGTLRTKWISIKTVDVHSVFTPVPLPICPQTSAQRCVAARGSWWRGGAGATRASRAPTAACGNTCVSCPTATATDTASTDSACVSKVSRDPTVALVSGCLKYLSCLLSLCIVSLFNQGLYTQVQPSSFRLYFCCPVRVYVLCYCRQLYIIRSPFFVRETTSSWDLVSIFFLSPILVCSFMLDPVRYPSSK